MNKDQSVLAKEISFCKQRNITTTFCFKLYNWFFFSYDKKRQKDRNEHKGVEGGNDRRKHFYCKFIRVNLK